MTKSDRRTLDIDRFVPALIIFLANRLNVTGAASFRSQLGISVLDFRILAMLAIEPAIPATRIVQVIGLDKALVSRTLAALAKRGLIVADEDPSHGRRRLVRLSKEGEELHDKALELALKREEALLGGLGPKQRDQLIAALNHMLERTEEVASAAIRA